MASIPQKEESPTVAAIYQTYVVRNGQGHREHLGASEIGEECNRKIWYSFRWCSPSLFDGRMLRLFETGRVEEARIIEDLRAMGCRVECVDENGRQFSFLTIGGHFGGSIDGAVLGIPEAPKTWHLLEVKTYNDKRFGNLKTFGVMKSDPKYYAQVIIYMDEMKFARTLFIVVNKNTDEIYLERIHADKIEAERIRQKASRIISSDCPPERISDDPSWWQCKYCGHYMVCHQGASPERSCRSCNYVQVIEGGWFCRKFMQKIEFQYQTGCSHYILNVGINATS